MNIKNFSQLKKTLKKYIFPGDEIYVESDILKFSHSINLNLKKDSLKKIYQLFKSLIGKKGTLICPTFSYSWGRDKKKKIFDIKKTQALTGSFPEYIRKRKDSFRTLDPMFSFVAIGKNKMKFYDTENDSFGKNSVFAKLFKSNAKLISFCLDRFDTTFVHYVEQFYHENISKIGYRKIVTKKGKLKNYRSKIITRKNISFLRNLNSNYFFSEKRIKKKLIEKKMLKVIKLKYTNIYIVNAQDFFTEGLINMIKNPLYFVTKK